MMGIPRMWCGHRDTRAVHPPTSDFHDRVPIQERYGPLWVRVEVHLERSPVRKINIAVAVVIRLIELRETARGRRRSHIRTGHARDEPLETRE